MKRNTVGTTGIQACATTARWSRLSRKLVALAAGSSLLIILCTTCLFSGCTTNKLHDKIVYKDNDFLCIDGVEYLVIVIGYRRYMAPHYKIDRFDNPKLIRCGAENEKLMD